MLSDFIPALARAIFIGAIGIFLGIALLVCYKGLQLLARSLFGAGSDRWLGWVMVVACLLLLGLWLKRRGKLL